MADPKLLVWCSFPLFCGQPKDLTDVEITPVLTWNTHLMIFKTISQMILKNHCIIYTFNRTRKNLWKITFDSLLNGPLITADLIKFKYSAFMLDTIDTKLYQPEKKKKNKYLNKLVRYNFTLKNSNSHDYHFPTTWSIKPQWKQANCYMATWLNY